MSDTPKQTSERTTPEPLHLEIIAKPHPADMLCGLRENMINVDGDSVKGSLSLGIIPAAVIWIELNGQTWTVSLPDLFRQVIARVAPDAVEAD